MIDTIFAQATPPGRSGIAVIRISGPDALAAAGRLTSAPLPPRRAVLRALHDPDTGDVIDHTLALAFPAPASFTGESVVELHCHGSRAVCQAVLDVLARQPGLRPAEAGEFTRRALENGRLDLTQVEGLADLLAAETEAQRRQAMSVMGGRLSRLAAEWREALVGALALVEATIDFADEDVPDGVLDRVPGILAGCVEAMDTKLAGSAIAERVREGFEVALIGAPNVGKSTLLNTLTGREVAITSSVAGTTRDVIEVRMDLRGLPVTLLDTAGLREAGDELERLGIERTRARSEAADLRVLLVAPGQHVHETQLQKEDVIVRCKADLGEPCEELAVSGLTGAGIDDLLERIAEILGRRASGAGALARVRQRKALESARMAAASAVDLILGNGASSAELVAEELHAALRALDVFVGRLDVEAVLDVIFRDFCIGK